ncbi:hypothetical protein DY000_02059439 [Brassica cretica]|uniref:Uncharacterized protein n=1 Tax=Brassica cretica TaxID=69181 RepID=A0ABQ7AVV5_BRACR|nr:hypothetical protein DY000_02059439 [Brassica cretica]
MSRLCWGLHRQKTLMTLFGIGAHITEINSLLSLQSEEVKVIGLVGDHCQRYWKSPRHKNLSIGFSEEIQISRNAFDGMNNLQFLQVYSSNLRSFGRGIKPLHCLKLVDLTESEYLKEIPDLSEATSLREIRTQFLRKFDRAHKLYWQNATKLKVCRFYGCLLLKELPSSIGRLTNLEELDLAFYFSGLKVFMSGCSSLEKLSGCLSLKKLNLSYTEIEKVPSSITTWSSSSCLYRSDMSVCKYIKDFPNVPDSIVEFGFEHNRDRGDSSMD